MDPRINFRLDQSSADPTEGMSKRKTIGGQNDKTFADMIQNAINSVDESHKNADQKVEDVVSGRSENIHEVMIAMQKANLSFQLMTEIRNRVIETYQELSRMPI